VEGRGRKGRGGREPPYAPLSQIPGYATGTEGTRVPQVSVKRGRPYRCPPLLGPK